MRLYSATLRVFDEYSRNERSWFNTQHSDLKNPTIAYFSAEFGLHRSIPIYSGGLGILAGDHCKEASDLGVPLVGVGFMYPQGYFRQRITPEGWQEAAYAPFNRAESPVHPALTPTGEAWQAHPTPSIRGGTGPSEASISGGVTPASPVQLVQDSGFRASAT